MRMGMEMLSSVPVVNWECLAGHLGFEALYPHSSIQPLEICASSTGSSRFKSLHQPDKGQLYLESKRQVQTFLTFSAAFPYGPLISGLCYPSSTNFLGLGPCWAVSVPLDKSARGVQPLQPQG